MNDNLQIIEKDLLGFKKDLAQIKTELTKQETIKQSLIDQLHKEYGLKDSKAIEKRLIEIKKEKTQLTDKITTLVESIKKQFSKVFGD